MRRTHGGIVVGEGGDATVRQWGGRPGARVTIPPPSGGKQKTQLLVDGNNDNDATIHDNEPRYNALVDALEQGGDLGQCIVAIKDAAVRENKGWLQ